MKENTKEKNKSKGAYFTSLISIFLVLLLLGIVGLLILNARHISEQIKENLCFSLMIKNNVKEPDIKKYQKTLDTYNFVKSTEYITKESAAEDLINELGEDFLTALGFNPLSPTINVYLKYDYTSSDSIAKYEKFILENNEIIEEISFQRNLIHEINDNIEKISIVLLFFCGILFLISFTLLNNTVRLQLYSKRYIINTMKLVGAKKSFIRRPFITSGISQGLIGSILAIAVLCAIIHFLDKGFGEEINFLNYEIIGILFATVLVLGIFLTLISTYFSINKYLKTKSKKQYY